MIYSTLPKLRATNVVACKCHLDDSPKGRYDMLLGQDMLTELVLNLEFSEHVIEADYGPFNGYTTPMVYLVKNIFKDLNARKTTPE